MNYLNLGCGTRYLPEWTNVDFVKTGEGVIAHNLTLGIPFPDNSFDVVYHSHVLEHFQKNQAETFISECYRVLKPDGIIRIAVPDLEQIARLYIQQLENAKNNPSPLNKTNYDWSVIEIYDQTVRNYSGGEMGKYWSQTDILNEDWIIQRMGSEFLSHRNSIKNRKSDTNSNSGKAKPTLTGWKKYFQLSAYQKQLLLWLSGEAKLFELLELARFRTGGEIHQWMYDSYSLGELLKSAGFKEIQKVDAFNSSIKDWSAHQWLDTEDGKVRKPDSLFMEAVK
jgi:predicted SAM-dependent methyltransferase